MSNQRDASSTTKLKWSSFAGMYVGYTLAIFNRKCFSFALPAIMISLHLDKNEAGLISSSQNLAYTISKFVGGILADSVNVKYLFCVGLFGSGLLTVSLAAFNSSWPFVIILFVQGLLQGGCWPACAKMLKRGCSPSNFNFFWGLLSTSMNVACALGPILTAYILFQNSFWKICFVIYGIAAVLGSVVSFMMIRVDDQGSNTNNSTAANQNLRGRGSWNDLLKSPFMWVVCLSYMLVFMARTAALDWGQLFIIQELGHSTYVGSLFISCMEVGGVLGSISAGYIADMLVADTEQTSSITGSPRMTVATVYVLILTVSLHLLLFFITSASSQIFIAAIGFLMGLGAYGPISIYGVMSMEASPVHLQGTSHAIASLAANVGAVTAGLPFSMVANSLNWRGAFIIMESTLAGMLVIKVLTRNLEYKMVSTKKKIQ
ncbi:hypothetical protein HELRODRAFT_185876 [Helobdella robusta]|uniref:Major facilitator superfamily (MFS) profile domain-containing protein n=1 Tax=Helobdella robusta TaxID=6412 RepID=T1FND9_HELRO|nr:hypothetical protein HELRODRAFT_185876 [Helobdella robusta]ESN98136.1 hypothetical protein HELRODRAFT_185876 [Helobdella robusta]